MRTGDRNRSCEREIGIADANEEIGIADANGEIGIADANGDGRGDRIEGRETRSEEELEAERNTAREGDKAPNLTNVRYSRIQVVACRSTVGGYAGIYIHKIDPQPRSLPPSRHPPDLYTVHVHSHAIPNHSFELAGNTKKCAAKAWPAV